MPPDAPIHLPPPPEPGRLKSVNISEIKIIPFCLKISDLCTFLHSYRLGLMCRWGCPIINSILGGLSLHLNQLIASRMTNYDWPFGTLPLDFLGQIWPQGTLRHILGTILVIFEIYHFLAIPGTFEYFSENGCSQKIKVCLMKEQLLPPYWFSFRRGT